MGAIRKTILDNVARIHLIVDVVIVPVPVIWYEEQFSGLGLDRALRGALKLHAGGGATLTVIGVR